MLALADGTAIAERFAYIFLSNTSKYRFKSSYANVALVDIGGFTKFGKLFSHQRV